jgi:hypothetical protein
VLSWIFRNRLRLSKIYGPAPAPALAGARFIRSRALDARREDPGAAGPGRLWVTRRFVWMRPMPRGTALRESSRPETRS